MAVLDGFGIRLTVERGHLVLQDGIGPHRRERRYSRAERTLRRIVILGHTGHLTLDAIRWCTDLGIVVVHLDPETGLNLHSVARTTDDARLRRAQAAAARTDVGLSIARYLLAAKVDGQAGVLEQMGQTVAAARVQGLSEQLQTVGTVPACTSIESDASNIYFGAWSANLSCRFAARDQARIPAHWTTFAARSSPLHQGGKSPRSAADPINAMLNYGYALAEAECRVAALAVGLDPGLGIVHTDKRDRDSLALDLLEPLRPVVDNHLLRMIETRHLRADDFHETRQGNCRILPPLTHLLAAYIGDYVRAIAPIAETVAHTLANTSPGKGVCPEFG